MFIKGSELWDFFRPGTVAHLLPVTCIRSQVAKIANVSPMNDIFLWVVFMTLSNMTYRNRMTSDIAETLPILARELINVLVFSEERS